MPDLAHDLRSAWRDLLAHRAVTVAAVLSLTLGIGATATIIAIADALLLHPLPYPQADRLVILWNRSPGLGIAEDWFSTAQYHDIATGHHGFDALAIAIGSNVNLTGDGEPERIGVIRASSNLLPLMGAQPALGRLFVPEEDAPGRPPSVVLSDRLWTRRYGRDPAIVGRTIQLNGQSAQIVGVLQATFALPREVLPTLGVAEDGEAFLPLPLGPAAATTRGHEDYNIVGRLAAGVTIARAQLEMDAITARLRHDFPDLYPPTGGLTFSIVPLIDQVVGRVRRPIAVLAGAVALVLLIACANVASLLLARAIGRRRDVAIRLSLGAPRARIARQLLIESGVVAFAGGLAGSAAAAAVIRGIQAIRPPDLPRLGEIAVSGEVLVIVLIVSGCCGLLFGLAPVAALQRLDVQSLLRDAERGSAGAGTVWARGAGLRRSLVVAEQALAVMLLVGAGLMLRSFAGLLSVQPGFQADHVLTLEITTTGSRYADAKAVTRAYRDLWARLDRVPGVVAAGGVSALPLSGYFSWGPITVDGRALPPGERFLNADQRVVSGRYFDAMGIRLLRGRFLDDRDDADHPPAIVVDQFMADELWPGVDPIGKRLRLGDATASGPWRIVVGVVGRVKQYTLEADGRIALYLPHGQAPSRALYATIRTDGDPAAITSGVRAALHDFDPNLPIYHLQPMTARVAQSLARQRFSLVALAWFAATALALAAIGVYGVMAYLVSQSTRDLGIRLALGATPAGIVRLVVGQSASIAMLGLVLGLIGAAALSGAVRSGLFGIGPFDPVTYAAVVGVLAAAACAASYVPARRAARIDPLISLRHL